MTQVFHNGTLLTDSGPIRNGMLVARDGRIEYAGAHDPNLIPPGSEFIDAGGLYISPGFVDIHVHGGAGSDFMDATAIDVETVFAYHAGYRLQHRALARRPATAPIEEILASLEKIAKYRSRGAQHGRALGAHIEGPYLADSKRGCHLPAHLRNPDDGEWRRILERGPIASLTLAPELPGARTLVEALHRQGANANAGHSEALYHEILRGHRVGRQPRYAPLLRHDRCNEQSLWRGTPNPPERRALWRPSIWMIASASELITDGNVHLSPEMAMRLAFRNKGYEKLAIITDAMRGAGMPDGEYTFGPRHGMRAIVRGREARIPDGTALASSVFPT